MGAAPDGPPLVALPERLDRRLRLGPFASARDALKFLCYAGAGALVAPFTAPDLWLPILAVGFVLSAWRPEGRAIDERCADFLAWKARELLGGRPMTRTRAVAHIRGNFLRIGPGQLVAILRADGAPFAYLPPTELHRRFDLFRTLLREMASSVAFLVGAEPIPATPVLPSRETLSIEAREAQIGYGELVGLLCRRRSQRKVYVALATGGTAPDAVSRLDDRARVLGERLAGLGLRTVRLSGRALRDAGGRFGWTAAPGSA